MRTRSWRLALAIGAAVLAIPTIATATHVFDDVEDGRFYSEPVEWAAENGITTGRTATIFDPNAPVTRGETVTFLKRYNDLIVDELSLTTDLVAMGRTAVGTGSSNPIRTSIAIGEGGNPLIAYYENDADQLRLFICDTIACESGSDRLLLNGAGDYPSIVVGRDGLPLIFHYENGGQDLELYRCSEADCSSGANVELASGGRYLSVAVRPDGDVFVAHENNDRLYGYRCNNDACTSGSNVQLDGTFNVGEYSSVAIADDGDPVISYYDSGNTSLKLYVCDDDNCDSGTARTLHDSGDDPDSEDVGIYTAVVIRDDGDPFVAYYDVDEFQLLGYDCANDACTSGTERELSETAEGGRHIDAMLSPDGNPLISFGRQLNSALIVVECTSQSCSSFDDHTIDSTSTGLYTSITTDPAGHPLIAYVDFETDVKVARLEYVPTGIG